MISVTIGDHERNLVISPRHVDKEQSMDWRHKVSSHPKISECKNPPENFSPRFFGIKTAKSSLIIFLRNYHHGVLLISAGAPDGRFEEKTPRESLQGGLVLARECSGSTDTCNPEETSLPDFPMSCSPILFSGCGPVSLPPVPCTKKNNRKLAIFRPKRRSLLPRRPGWKHRILNILEWLSKLQQRAKTCIVLRVEYVE